MQQPRVIMYLDANIDENLVKTAMRELEGRVLIKALHHDLKTLPDESLLMRLIDDFRKNHMGSIAFILTSDSNFDRHSGWTIEDEISLIKVPDLKRNAYLPKVILSDLKRFLRYLSSTEQLFTIRGLVVVGSIGSKKGKKNKKKKRAQ